MFKRDLLALTLVFSLPIFAVEHWVGIRAPEQCRQGHVQGAISISLKEAKKCTATAIPDKNGTVEVYCSAGCQSGQAREVLSEMGYTYTKSTGSLKDIAMPKVKG